MVSREYLAMTLLVLIRFIFTNCNFRLPIQGFTVCCRMDWGEVPHFMFGGFC